MNPFMEKEKAGSKIASNAKLTVGDIFPISASKVKKFMTQEKARTTVKSILVAPKNLVISIIEEDTSAILETLFEQRAKEVKEGSRGGGFSKSTTSEGPTISRSFSSRSGVSFSLVI